MLSDDAIHFRIPHQRNRVEVCRRGISEDSGPTLQPKHLEGPLTCEPVFGWQRAPESSEIRS